MGSSPSKPPRPGSFAYLWTNFFPPTPPPFPASVLPSDLSGRVFLITGANSGMGKALAQVLYSRHAKVWITARTQDKLTATIADLQAGAPDSCGLIVGLELELSDLASVQRAGQRFAKEETRLDVMFNNAGVMTGPGPMLKTKQGLELAVGVNCVGTFLFTRLVTPVLKATVRDKVEARVVWVSSWGLYDAFKGPMGFDFGNLDYHLPVPGIYRYAVSKAGVWALGVEYARRYGEQQQDGIVSVTINPGNIQTGLTRSAHWLLVAFAKRVVYPVENGVATQLYAGFAEETGKGRVVWGKQWVVPFGRVFPQREDIVKATKPESEGGTGGTRRFWEWCEEQSNEYLPV